MVLDAAESAELALLVEAGSMPKPGNVEPSRDFPDTSYHQFQAGAVGARSALEDAAADEAIGRCFRRAVKGASRHEGGNTHFGALLLLTPLVQAEASDGVDSVDAVVEDTTVDDAEEFYRAFQAVEVNLGDVEPDGLPDAGDDDAAEKVRERGLTLYQVMEGSADVDDVASEWVNGFERAFRRADDLQRLVEDGSPTSEAVASVYLEMLRTEPDSHVARIHGDHVADDVVSMANNLDVAALDRRLRYDDINPGATADVLSAACFVALTRGGLGI